MATDHHSNGAMASPTPVLTTTSSLYQKVRTNVKNTVVVLVIICLVVSNVLTVLNDSVHTMGHNLLQAVAAAFLTKAALSHLTSNSPTCKHSREIATAKRIEKENATLTAKNQRLTESKRKLAMATRVLSQQHAALGQKHAFLGKSHGKLEQTMRADRAAMKAFTKRLAVRTTASVSRNVSLIYGKSVPIIGVGVIIGGVTWEAYDACQTMKGINNLHQQIDGESEDLNTVCGIKIPTREEALHHVSSNWKAAYEAAARTIASIDLPVAAPQLSWPDVRKTICPMISGHSSFCS